MFTSPVPEVTTVDPTVVVSIEEGCMRKAYRNTDILITTVRMSECVGYWVAGVMGASKYNQGLKTDLVGKQIAIIVDGADYVVTVTGVSQMHGVETVEVNDGSMLITITIL